MHEPLLSVDLKKPVKQLTHVASAMALPVNHALPAGRKAVQTVHEPLLSVDLKNPAGQLTHVASAVALPVTQALPAGQGRGRPGSA